MTQVSFADDRGMTLIRAVRALVISQGSMTDGADFARSAWGNATQVADVLEQRLLDTGRVDDPAGPARALGRFIVELVLRRSALGRLDALRQFFRAPVSAPVLGITQHVIATWTGEGHAYEVSDMAFAVRRLAARKLGVILIYTLEFLRLMDPNVDGAIRRDIVRAMSAALDSALLSPDNLGIDGIQPANVYGTNITAGSGNAAWDLGNALAGLSDGQIADCVLVLNPADVAAAIEQGLSDAGSLNIDGGYLCGYPAICSTAIPRSAVAWIVPPEILLTDAGLIIEHATQATFEAIDPDTHESTIHSLWVENLASLRATYFINWQATTDNAAGLITDCINAAGTK
ncbi:putative Phage capsid family protein [Paraburkholderia ribeironis]|uniref:Putative Phage capsid family protein n=1 Tax=Paraburkholderia ribeironis TaxID=1247936 RepID=A0A1N7S4K8_9BURK|nr:phage major capsid protein [Paraburkholderia ribeironis]SIT42228.1 putative Phage capsid family protein [Paraburkholderia ribeironis]